MEISELEIENANLIQDMLFNIENISYSRPYLDRPDVILVSFDQEDSNTIIIDVEETIITAMVEVCGVDDVNSMEVFPHILEYNNTITHGAIVISDDRLWYKGNLEIENIDLNELDALLVSADMAVSEELIYIIKEM